MWQRRLTLTKTPNHHTTMTHSNPLSVVILPSAHAPHQLI